MVKESWITAGETEDHASCSSLSMQVGKTPHTAWVLPYTCTRALEGLMSWYGQGSFYLFTNNHTQEIKVEKTSMLAYLRRTYKALKEVDTSAMDTQVTAANVILFHLFIPLSSTRGCRFTHARMLYYHYSTSPT